MTIPKSTARSRTTPAPKTASTKSAAKTGPKASVTKTPKTTKTSAKTAEKPSVAKPSTKNKSVGADKEASRPTSSLVPQFIEVTPNLTEEQVAKRESIVDRFASQNNREVDLIRRKLQANVDTLQLMLDEAKLDLDKFNLDVDANQFSKEYYQALMAEVSTKIKELKPGQ